MSDELFLQYERELSYLRKLGGGFARAHPKIAGRLRLSGDAIEDPHVSRLVEGVAFLNARVRAKLEDDFPELTDAILGVLYPHLLAPVPSMAVVRFDPDPDMTAGFTVPRGSQLETDSDYGTPCRYRTAYPVVTWPLEVRSARLSGAPFQAPPAPRGMSPRAVLQVALGCTNRGTSLDALAPNELRFFLSGDPTQVHQLYQLIFNNVLGVAIAVSADDLAPVHLPPDCLQQVGFGRDEGLLPYSGRSSLAHRLLTEFFAFPSKFLFVDVKDLPRSKLGGPDEELHLFLYLDDTQAELEHALSADNFALGCTPVVNLFERHAEPIQLDHTESELHVVADARQPLASEIYSIDSVEALSRDGRKVEFRPFFGIDHRAADDDEHAFWYAARRPAPPTESAKDEGTELHLSLVDLAHHTATLDDWVLMTEVTCLNRDLPNKLPFGGGHPKLDFAEGGGPIQAIRCITPPTPTRRNETGQGALWRLVSQLSVNHLALSSAEGASVLREILRIHDVVQAAESRTIIDGLLSLESRETAMRIDSAGLAGICRGTEVTVHLDHKRLATSGLFLFASVLERFLASSCTLNTFVQVNVTTTAREGVLRRWSPRSGTRQLL